MHKPEEVGMKLFAHKSTGRRQKITGKIVDQKWPGFFICLLNFQLSPSLIMAIRTLKLINNIPYVIILKSFFFH